MLQTHCMVFGLERTAIGRTTRAMMMLKFSGTKLGVVAASVVGVWLGDALHRRVNSAAVASATLLFLSVASVQMLSTDLRIRLTLASMLALVAARVHRETLAVYLSQSLLTALAPTVRVTKLDGVAGRRRHDADEMDGASMDPDPTASDSTTTRSPKPGANDEDPEDEKAALTTAAPTSVAMLSDGPLLRREAHVV